MPVRERSAMNGQRGGERDCEAGGLRQSILNREWVEKRPFIRIYHSRSRIEGDWAGGKVQKSRERAAPRSTTGVWHCSDPA